MSTAIILSYLLLVVGIAAWAFLIPARRLLSPRLTDGINTFGGAFLLASCFINLLPHLFTADDPFRFVTPQLHFKISAAVLIGFLIQLLLDQLTQGAEHGHSHTSAPSHPQQTIHALLIGLCIHAFLEGMPLVDPHGDIHQGLLFGIFLHNIPITLILISLFMARGYRFWPTLALLLLFALMTPLGSLCNLYLLPPSPTLQTLIMGMVVGILLHVSLNILFSHDHNTFSWGKITLILTAFIAAYFTPGCPEIYGSF